MNRLITILLTLVTLSWAQASIDGWYKFPLISEDIDDLVEASTKVYYLSGGTLFSFSTDDNEAYAYSNINKLSGTTITGIYYNYDNKYLVVAYDDGNMDILYDNGKMINLPEIRDAQFTDTKTINCVTFGEGYIVVATNFGVVVYREDKMEVKESSIFNTDIMSAAIHGGRIFINYRGSSGHSLFWAPFSERHNSLDKFTELGSFYPNGFYFLDDETIVVVNLSNGRLYYTKINYDAGSLSTTYYNNKCEVTSKVYQYKDGYYAYSDDTLYKVTSTSDAEEVAIPTALQGNKLAFYDTSDQLWAGDGTGVGLYDISSSTPTTLYDRIAYNDAITCSTVAYMRWSADGARLYISNLTCTTYKAFGTVGDFIDAYQTTNIVEDGYTTDASLMNASATEQMTIKRQTTNGNTRMYGDPAWMIEDPDNPDIYYIANNHEGLYVVQRNSTTGEYEEIAKINSENGPIEYLYGSRCQDVNIDPQGNLWIGYREGCHYSVLPAAKRQQGMEYVTSSDWIEHTKLEGLSIDNMDSMSVFCTQSNMMFVFTGLSECGLVAIDTKGTYADPSDDTVYHWTTFTDQDGNSYIPTRISYAIEDSRGCLWVGTSTGVFEITDPTTATSNTMTIRRIKVPRNDGTNYADYLLGTDQVYWISEDHSGRKWIASEVSGLFLVSETGDEIIENYTKDNSPLPSNMICSVECDPSSNLVYVGTGTGLYTFLGTSSPAQEDYSQICAYPNPVRPEFYGDVTISGLMENSIVKIADVSGNVVAQIRSEGGMASWNVCNLSGKRVKSGVYYVFATTSDGSTSSGAVTKILVIN